MDKVDLDEFDRQASLILRKDVLGLFPSCRGKIRTDLAQLKQELETVDVISRENIPFCIVINERPFPTESLMGKILVKNARGVVDMPPVSPEDFSPIQGLELPATSVYIILDVDTGRSGLNVSPEESLKAIQKEGRTPLTLEEGVMLATFYPELFTDKKRFNCIQMPGSRISGDQRVPSLWFSKGAPRLGWCWDRNVHSWLASASGASRFIPTVS